MSRVCGCDKCRGRVFDWQLFRPVVSCVFSRFCVLVPKQVKRERERGRKCAGLYKIVTRVTRRDVSDKCGHFSSR